MDNRLSKDNFISQILISRLLSPEGYLWFYTDTNTYIYANELLFVLSFSK